MRDRPVWQRILIFIIIPVAFVNDIPGLIKIPPRRQVSGTGILFGLKNLPDKRNAVTAGLDSYQTISQELSWFTNTRKFRRCVRCHVIGMNYYIPIPGASISYIDILVCRNIFGPLAISAEAQACRHSICDPVPDLHIKMVLA